MANSTPVIATRHPGDETADSVSGQRSRAGFGLCTEIDHKGSYETKLNAAVAPPMIRGVCGQQAAGQAQQTYRPISALLSVGVGSADGARMIVVAFAPATMTPVMDRARDAPRIVSYDARARLLMASSSQEGQI